MGPFAVCEISTAPKELLSSSLQGSACSLPVLSDTPLCTGSVTPRPMQAVSSDPGTHWNNCWDPPFLSACPAGRSQASCVWHPQPRTLGAYRECPLILQAQLPQGVLRAISPPELGPGPTPHYSGQWCRTSGWLLSLLDHPQPRALPGREKRRQACPLP